MPWAVHYGRILLSLYFPLVPPSFSFFSSFLSPSPLFLPFFLPPFPLLFLFPPLPLFSLFLQPTLSSLKVFIRRLNLRVLLGLSSHRPPPSQRPPLPRACRPQSYGHLPGGSVSFGRQEPTPDSKLEGPTLTALGSHKQEAAGCRGTAGHGAAGNSRATPAVTMTQLSPCTHA